MVLNGLSELLKWQQVSGGWRQQVLEKPAWQCVPQLAALASCLRVSGGGEQRQGSEIEAKRHHYLLEPGSLRLPQHLVGDWQRGHLLVCLGTTPLLPLLPGGRWMPRCLCVS